MTLPSYVTHDASTLARHLREHGMRGYQPVKKIQKLRKERRERNAPLPRVPDVSTRANNRITARYVAEVARRGGETFIEGSYRDEHLRITDRRTDGLVLLHVEGWRQYSRSFGARRASLSYLCGTEDGQRWAVRVPGTLTTVFEALYWLTPAQVRKAKSSGLQVWRQGDVYAIETTRAHDGKGAADLPENHTWNPETRTLTHPEHGETRFPEPVRFVAQSALVMGRAGGRGSAD